MHKPEPMTPEQIATLYEEETGFTIEGAYSREIALADFSREIEAAVNAKWEEMLAKQEPIGYVDDYNSSGYYVANTPTNTYKTLKPLFRAPVDQAAEIERLRGSLPSERMRASQWESARVDDYNNGWNDCCKAVRAALGEQK